VSLDANFERLTRIAQAGDSRAGEALVHASLRQQLVPFGGGPKIWVHFLADLQRCVQTDNAERGRSLAKLMSQVPDEKVLRWTYGAAKYFGWFGLVMDVLLKLTSDLTAGHLLGSEVRSHRERRLVAVWHIEMPEEFRALQGMDREQVEENVRELLQARYGVSSRASLTELLDDGDGGVTGTLRLRPDFTVVGPTERGPEAQTQLIRNEADLQNVGLDPATDEELFEGERDLVEAMSARMAEEIDADILADLHIAAEQEVRVRAAMERFAPLLEGVTDERSRRITALLLQNQDTYLRNQGHEPRRGRSFLEAGFVWVPYVSVQTTPTFVDPDDLAPRTRLAPRYVSNDLRWNIGRALIRLHRAGGSLPLSDFVTERETADVDDRDIVAGIFKLDEEAGIVSIGKHPPMPNLPWCFVCNDDRRCHECDGHKRVHSDEIIESPCTACDSTGATACDTCLGTAFIEPGVEECYECEGTGEMPCDDCFGTGVYEERVFVDCDECNGTGACECTIPKTSTTPATTANSTTATTAPSTSNP